MGRYAAHVAKLLLLTASQVLSLAPNSRRYLVPKHGNIGEGGASSERNIGNSLASAASNNSLVVEDEKVPPGLSEAEDRRMDLMWCDTELCKDVVRERVVGEHNQIVLNGPATGQVAYRWSRKTSPITPGKKQETALTSVLLLVKPTDEQIKKAADIVPQLTEAGIKVLLQPDLAAKLKYYYDVEDEYIGLFETPKDPNKQASRHVDEPEEAWVQSFEPFPDLVCTLGGDGLLIHASMLFQGPIPPIISIAGGSLGFLTPFSESEMVDAIQVALGMATDENSDDEKIEEKKEELEVFPPNMEAYPYEAIVKAPHIEDTSPKFSFGMGDIICMTIRMRLDCRIVSPGGTVRARYNVLNEVVIDRGSSPWLAALECFCDDVHLTTVQADGVIFAT